MKNCEPLVPGGESSWCYSASTHVNVSGGIVSRPPAARETEALHKGVKLILLLNGRLQCALPDEDETLLGSPCLCAVVNGGDYLASQMFDPSVTLRYVIVGFDHETGATFFDIHSDDLSHRYKPFAPRLIRLPLENSFTDLSTRWCDTISTIGALPST